MAAQAGTESIRFVVCPNGTDGNGNYQLSVFLGVILSGGPKMTLADFPDFQKWPDTLIDNNLELQLTFEVSGSRPYVTTVAIDTSVLNEDLWENLFPLSTTYVEQTAANQPQATVPTRSFPIKPIHDFFTTGGYQQLPTTKPPSYDDVAQVFGDIRPTVIGVSPSDSFSEIQARQAQERLTPRADGTIPYANDFTDATTPEALAALATYFTPVTPATPPGVTPNPLDFHGAQVFIGEHSWLQRALGLTFDVLVPISDLSQAGVISPTLTSDLYVSATLTTPHIKQNVSEGKSSSQASPDDFSGSGANLVATSPQTQCFASTSGFEAYSDTTDTSSLPIASRMLISGDETRVVAHTIDVELTGTRMISFSAALQTSVSPVDINGQSPAGLLLPAPSFPAPQVNSGGLSLSLINRGLLLNAQLVRATALFTAFNKGTDFSPQQTPLTASDLTRGLILDVFDTTTSTWYSTNRRTLTYTSPAPGNTANSGTTVQVTVEDDEGGTQAPPTVGTDDSGALYTVSETVLRYRGWSNAVPLPGTPASDQDSALSPYGGPFGNEIQIDLAPVPGTLPRLRFGRTYYLRARVVDVAGNVVPLSTDTPIDDADGENITNGPILYGRYEVIGSPDVIVQNSSPNNYPTPAEGRLRLVIRDVDAADNPTSNRVLAPSRTTEAFAEVHGMFDTGPGGSLDPNAYANVITKDNQYGYPRDSGNYPVPPQDFSNPSSSPPPPTAIDITQPVPYLPDPLSRGGVITVDAGSHSDGTFGSPMSASPLAFDFSPASGGSWPDYRPVLLTLQPVSVGTESINYDDTTRTITVGLSPGDTVHVLLASTFDAADVATYGMGQLIPSVDANKAAAGQYYGITPTTELELIYAVTAPLVAPSLVIDTPDRSAGDTFVMLSGYCRYSPKTTGKIQVFATWEDPIDVPGSGYAPERVSEAEPVSHTKAVSHAKHSREVTRHEHGRKASRHERDREPHIILPIPINLPPEPSGTLMGPGTPTPTPGSPTNVPVFHAPPPMPAETDVEVATLVSVLNVQTTANPSVTGFANFGNLALEDHADSFAGARQEFHDTKHRLVTYTAIATTRFASLYNTTPPSDPSQPPPDYVSADDLTLTGPASASVDIKSTARPGAVNIPYVVPIYDWEDVVTSPFTGEITTGRSPSALRVFIERPWWSSGIGELLGVVLSGNFAQRTPIGEPEDLYVTDWGADPLFASGPLPAAHPNVFSFPNTVATGGSLTIEENSSFTVDVAGHDVSYDVLRDLWYADVAIDTGAAYTPFIRLAVARFQPDSISGVELGRIAQADIMSLEPGRSVSIIPYEDSDGNFYLNVALSGYSYSESAALHDIVGGGSGAPGLAQVLVEERDSTVSDDDLGWVAVTNPVTMNPQTSGGITTWSARGIQVPSRSGQYRLYINQYEILPSEDRTPLLDTPPPPASSYPQPKARDVASARRAAREHARRRAHTSGAGDPTPPGYRLLYQDMIPVPNHLTSTLRTRPRRTGR